MPLNRRMPFRYKHNKVKKENLTSRKELHPITRAFVVSVFGSVLPNP